MFSLPLFALLVGASMASLIQLRQEEDLAARVKALEDFLAEPDSSCVNDCGNAWDTCADQCPVSFASEDSDFNLDARLFDCDKEESVCNGKCTVAFPPK